MKASATSADGGTSRETKEEGEGDEGETRKGWSTWLGGVFLVPGFRLLGREARGSFCSPRRRIRRPTLSPPTRSSPLPPPALLLLLLHYRHPSCLLHACPVSHAGSTPLQATFYPAATPVAPRFSTPTLLRPSYSPYVSRSYG